MWRGDVDLADGERYGFVLGDRDDLRPDPRSRRQPDGVHAASAAFDPNAFEWTDASWTGRQLAGGSCTSSTSARSRPKEHWMPQPPGSTTSSGSG
jgi:1,4-alpha-glucan branching enzyme